MKIIKLPATGQLGLVIFAGLFLLCSSCVKTNTTNYYNPPSGFVNVVQASPDEPPLNFYLSGKISVDQPLQFGNFTYYIRSATGAVTASFNNASSSAQVVSNPINVSQNQYYSLFLVNTAASPQYLFLTDTLKQPAAGQASIRFLNLSPDEGPVDFTVQGAGTTVSNKAFTGSSGFVSVAPGNYTLQVTKTGTSTVVATLPNAKLAIGGMYTIWLQGLSTGTTANDSPGIGMMTNAQF